MRLHGPVHGAGPFAAAVLERQALKCDPISDSRYRLRVNTMPAPRTLIAGNWKMNMLVAEGLALARGIDARARAESPGCGLVVCPPATILRPVSEAVAGGPVSTGGQDCHAEEKGAFTGDISAAMLDRKSTRLNSSH